MTTQDLPQLREDLKNVCTALQRLLSISLASSGALLAILLWLWLEGGGQGLVLPCMLISILAYHFWYLGFRRLIRWVEGLDARLGQGAGWAVVESTQSGAKMGGNSFYFGLFAPALILAIGSISLRGLPGHLGMTAMLGGLLVLSEAANLTLLKK